MIFDQNERFHNSCKISFYGLPSSWGPPPHPNWSNSQKCTIGACNDDDKNDKNLQDVSDDRSQLLCFNVGGKKYFVLRWEILCVMWVILCTQVSASVNATTFVSLHEDLCCAFPQGLPWNSNAVFCQRLFWKWKSKFLASHFIISETQTNYKYVRLRPRPIQ